MSYRMNTKEDQIKRDRYVYGKNMAIIMNSLFRRNGQYIDHKEESQTLDRIIEIAEKMTNIFNNMSEEDKRIYLDGEFPTWYLGPDNDLSSDIGAPQFPLYLFADIAMMSIDSHYIYEPRVPEENKKKATNLRAHLQVLRRNFQELNYSDKFDCNKHISPEAWQGMSSSMGRYTVRTERKEELDFFEMSYTLTSDDGVWRNGDYYYNNVYRSHHKAVLYQEDAKELAHRKFQREKKESEEYYSHFKKYFKNGIIPMRYQGFEEHLIDPTIDPRIIEEIGSFVLMYNDAKKSRGYVDFAHSEHASYYLEDLQRAERLVQREKEEAIQKRQEKDNAIVEARARYQQRSFFWKLLNRKLNPERLSFETMETTEIENLYTGGRKK